MSCPWTPEDCPGQLAEAVVGDAFDSVARRFGQFAESAITWLWQQISVASAVYLDDASFTRQLKFLSIVTGVVAVGLFALQLTTSALRRDAGGLARGLKGVVVAFLGGGVAISVTNVLLAATDGLADGIVKAATGGTIEEMGRALVATGAIQGATGNAAGTLLLSLFALVATVAVWGALMVRKVLLVLSAAFAPVAFAGSIADFSVSWTRRWIETTVALIVSKVVLVVIFVVGLEVLVGGAGQAGGGATQSATQVVSGLLVLLVAGTAPLLALKLVHFSGNQFHEVRALAATSTVGAQRAVDWSRSAATKASMVAGPAFGGGFRTIGSSSPRTGAVPPNGGGGGRDADVPGHQPPPAPPRRVTPTVPWPPPKPGPAPPGPDPDTRPEPPPAAGPGRAEPDRRRP
ncbi:MAG TPA: hypothetical protein VFO65_09960 [Acidimicrobiales bacterium]|nr:hypothetical protein [Acidimicrobiales bacterium]